MTKLQLQIIIIHIIHPFRDYYWPQDTTKTFLKHLKISFNLILISWSQSYQVFDTQTGSTQKVPPQPVLQHFWPPRHCKSAEHVMAQMPTPTGGGHCPEFWAQTRFVAQTKPRKIKNTQNVISRSYSECFVITTSSLYFT